MCGSVVRLGVMSYLGGGSDPLVCEGPSAHGVERGAPPMRSGRPKHPSDHRSSHKMEYLPL